jgi:hypothetical protein
MGSRGRDRYGKAGREAAAAVDAIAALVDRFDPGLTGARDAFDLVAEFSRLEHLASAGVALAARRVAQTDLWKRGGHRSAAHWLAHVTGMGVGDAVRLLQTAETVEAAPDTREALRAGAVSVRQAKAIGAAEAVDPDAGQRLLADAPNRSTKETEDAAARVVAAASTESVAERAERHRKARSVFHGVDADGMGWGRWRLPIAEHVRVVAQLDGEQCNGFAAARAGGVREPVEAYAADALCRIFDRAARKATDASAYTDTSNGNRNSEDWSFTKMIVRVDLAALDRGELAPGEVCEVAGRGPIPVADAWRMIDGDAFVAAVSTNGTKIDQVVHLGRKPTVLQRTALEWFSAGECSIEGCTSPARLEIDHVADWAHTERTELAQLALPCGHHHDLKTHHGYTFGPLLPSGKRRLIAPRGADPPSGTGPPGLTLVHGDPDSSSRARSDDIPREGRTQPGLFDTG